MLKALKLSELTGALNARLIAADATFDGVSIDSRAIMHIPNGGLRNDRVAANLKAQGTVAGYPDIMVFKPKAVQVHVPIMKARAFTLDDLARGKETGTRIWKANAT